MRCPETNAQILAITYADAGLATSVMLRLVRKLQASGKTCGGFLQQDDPPCNGRSRCDMFIECLSTGQRLKISEDRGPLARGCRLDVGALVTALAVAREAIHARPDVLVVNKFGKTESEGGGFRPLIADAIELAVPVVIAVPWRNIESWRLFAGDFATEIAAETVTAGNDALVLAAIGLALRENWPTAPLSDGPVS